MGAQVRGSITTETARCVPPQTMPLATRSRRKVGARYGRPGCDPITLCTVSVSVWPPAGGYVPNRDHSAFVRGNCSPRTGLAPCRVPAKCHPDQPRPDLGRLIGRGDLANFAGLGVGQSRPNWCKKRLRILPSAACGAGPLRGSHLRPLRLPQLTLRLGPGEERRNVPSAQVIPRAPNRSSTQSGYSGPWRLSVFERVYQRRLRDGGAMLPASPARRAVTHVG